MICRDMKKLAAWSSGWCGDEAWRGLGVIDDDGRKMMSRREEKTKELRTRGGCGRRGSGRVVVVWCGRRGSRAFEGRG